MLVHPYILNIYLYCRVHNISSALHNMAGIAQMVA